ncbi:MAG: OmpA family protein [Candidatus Kapaibacterium sp.]
MKYITLIAVTIFFTSCGSNKPPRALTECPVPPPPQCKPEQWQGKPFDTTSTGKFAPETYWHIQKVNGASESTNGEYGLSFINTKNAVLTYERNNIQGMIAVQMLSDTSVQHKDTVTPPGRGSFASPTFSGNTIVYSSYPAGAYVSDADVFAGTWNSDSIRNQQYLPFSKEIAWDAQPALSPDGNVLFFSSDREGGFGGTDIWLAVKQPNGTWGTPINAGNTINTPCDELTPFVTANGQLLLFSSAGHQTVGGYDIFQSTIQLPLKQITTENTDKFFSKPVNLGAPLNTTADEIFPSSPSNINTVIYYTSNQTDRTNFDVYVRHRLTFPKQNIAKKDEPKKEGSKKERVKSVPVKLRGKVYNTRNQPVKDADIKVRDVEDKEIITHTSTDTAGNYVMDVPSERELEVTAEYEKGFYDSYKITLHEGDTTVRNFIIPERLSLRINFPNDDFQTPYKNVLDSNGTETNQAWIEELNLLAENLKKFKNTIKKIMLVGHTDENGADDYNIGLGQRRANFVVEELVKRGLPRTMFETRSAGEAEPLQRRAGETNDIYFKRNRRVELSKVSK